MDFMNQDVKDSFIKKILDAVPNISVKEVELWIEQNKLGSEKLHQSVVEGLAIGRLKQTLKLADMDEKRAYYLGSTDDSASFNSNKTHHLFISNGQIWEGTTFGSKPKGVIAELKLFHEYTIKINQQTTQGGYAYTAIESYTELKTPLFDFDSLRETDLESLPDLNKKIYPIVLKGSFFQVEPYEQLIWNKQTKNMDKGGLFPGYYENKILFQSKLFKERFYIDIILSIYKTGHRTILPLGDMLDSVIAILQSSPVNENEYKRLNPSFTGEYTSDENDELIKIQVTKLAEILTNFDFISVGLAYVSESDAYRADLGGNIVNVKFNPTILKLSPKTSFEQPHTTQKMVGNLEGFEEFYTTLSQADKDNILPAIQVLQGTGLFEYLKSSGMVLVSGEQNDQWKLLVDVSVLKPILQDYWKLRTNPVKVTETKTDDLSKKISDKISQLRMGLPTIDDKQLVELLAKEFTIPTDQLLKFVAQSKPKVVHNGKEINSKKGSDIYKLIEQLLRNLDAGKGVEFSAILGAVLKPFPKVKESVVDDILYEMAYDGKVYQPRPDFYKIMD